jgi:hypothetical protein
MTRNWVQKPTAGPMGRLGRIVRKMFHTPSILDSFDDLVCLDFHTHDEKSKAKTEAEHDIEQNIFSHLATANYNFNVKTGIQENLFFKLIDSKELDGEYSDDAGGDLQAAVLPHLD